MSVKLYIAKIPDELNCDILSQLSEHRKNKLSSARNKRYIAQSIAGELLLEIAVEGLYSRPLPIKITENGKPFLEGNKRYFNISHSGEYVACVVADFELGLDIQIEREVDFRLAERYFTEDECEYLKSDCNAFPMLWTKKESHLKALGCGLSGGLDRFSVLKNEQEYFYHQLGELHISICVPDAENVNVDIYEIKLL